MGVKKPSCKALFYCLTPGVKILLILRLNSSEKCKPNGGLLPVFCTHFEHWYVFQELREEGNKISSNLANIRGVCRVISHVAVPSTNGIVYKQNIGRLHL